MTKGEQIRDFCFVDDVCEAIIACLDNEKVNGEIINIASGIPISIKSMAIKIQDLIGKGTLKIGDLPDRSNTNQSLYADNNLARNLLNWTPNISLEQGLKKSIDFYKSLHESK